MKPVIFALAALMALPAHAQSFRSTTGMTVTPAGPNSFYISGIPENTPQSHWCSAAEYSHRVLGTSFSQRMYIVGDSKSSARKYLVSLDPRGTASEGSRSKEFGVRIDGANRRVDEGLDFCSDRFLLRRR